ncbi:MAG TPA: tetratricopeptide repeat protein [Roseiflexaceae bacterium]
MASQGLQISTLGGLTIARDGIVLTTLGLRKAEALLVYLVCTPRPHAREVLIDLLWDNLPADRARANLSLLLTTLRQQIGPYLLATRSTVAFDQQRPYWLDVVELERQCQVVIQAALRAPRSSPPAEPWLSADEAAQLDHALALYQGDFLQGFTPHASADFETWVRAEQERVRQLVVMARQALMSSCTHRGAYDTALAQANQLLHLDPFHEDVHRQALLLLTYSGQRGAALAHYEAYRRMLDAELGMAPPEEMAALYQQIRSGIVPGPSQPPMSDHQIDATTLRAGLHAPAEEPDQAEALRGFPTAQTAFVGRTKELAQIAQRLGDPACRLLTLLGPGGIGKTRLALEAARRMIQRDDQMAQHGIRTKRRFADGAAFVALSGIAAAGRATATHLAAAIGDAVTLTFSGPQDPQAQLLAYLRDKRLLLVLDNLEHLLDGIDLLHMLLQHAPQLAILATSRERLNLQAEWLIDVPGIDIPTYQATVTAGSDSRFQKAWPTPAQLEAYAAVQLFLQCAIKGQPHFALTADTVPAVLRICQLVDGMPLAIELAAAWVRTVPCDQIAAEIARNVDFLSTSLRDVPARHRSMRAVFDHSWALLNDGERAMLSRVSVFRGGFTAEAATMVCGDACGAEPPVGRAASTSVPRPQAMLAALVDKSLLRTDSHGRYDMHELVRQYANERLAATPDDQARTRERHSRYYAAWLQHQEALLTGPQQAMALDAIGIDLENVRAGWSWAVDQQDAIALEQSLGSVAVFYEVRNRLQEGESLFGYAAAALRTDPASSRPDHLHGRLLARQGIFCERLGSYDEGKALLQRSLALLGAADDQRELALALGVLGKIDDRQGRYHDAYDRYHTSLTLYQKCGDQWGLATAMYNLGSACEGLRQYDEARRWTAESLAIRQTLGDIRGAALSLNLLGIVAEMQGDYPAALRLYQESLERFTALGDRWAMLLPLANLGDIATTQGDYAAGHGYYLRALQLAYDLWAVPKMLSALVRIATILAHRGEREAALELLVLPLDYPATEQAFRDRASTLLAGLRTELDPEIARRALERAQPRTLETTVQSLLLEGGANQGSAR